MKDFFARLFAEFCEALAAAEGTVDLAENAVPAAFVKVFLDGQAARIPAEIGHIKAANGEFAVLADSDFPVFRRASDESARADIYQAVALFAAEFIDALDMHMPREGKLHAVICKERSNGAPIPDLGVAHEVKNGHGRDNRVVADRKNEGVRSPCVVKLSLSPLGQALVDTTPIVCGAVTAQGQHPDSG